MTAPLQFRVMEFSDSEAQLDRIAEQARAFARAHPPGSVIDFTRGDPAAGDAAIETLRELKGKHP